MNAHDTIADDPIFGWPASFPGDEDDHTVIYDSSWPTIDVATPGEAFLVSDDLAAYEAGEISADDFVEMWGIHPDADYSIVIGA